MSAIDIIGIVGELLSWFGAVIGIPFLVAALIFRGADGKRQATNIGIVEDLDRQRVAFWTIGGRTYSRPITERDQLPRDHGTTITGYVSPRHPGRLELHKRSHAERLCATLAITLLSVAVAGFIASLLPIFW